MAVNLATATGESKSEFPSLLQKTESSTSSWPSTIDISHEQLDNSKTGPYGPASNTPLTAASQSANCPSPTSSTVRSCQRHADIILAQSGPQTSAEELADRGLKKESQVGGMESCDFLHRSFPSDRINVYPDDRHAE